MPAPASPRLTGRLWTVRIVPRGRPAEGISGLECSAPGCATVANERHRVPAQARAAALAHLAVHARQAGAAREQASCRCRSEGCAWHTTPGRCGGQMCLVVVPDRYGRVWRLAEACARCVAAIPHTRIVSAAAPKPAAAGASDTPAKPRPTRVPEGFTAPDTSGAPRQRVTPEPVPMAVPETSPPPPVVSPASPAPVPQARTEKAPAAAAPAVPKPLTTPSGKPLLTAGQAVVLRRLWDYLASRRPGSSTEGRLLALLCTPRAARSARGAGRANLLAQDLTGLLKLTDPRAAVRDLVACGWLGASVEEVMAAAKVPVECGIPDFADPQTAPFRVAKSARSRLSGWCMRLLSHKRLRKQSAGIRLVAAYAAAHAASTGVGEVELAHLAAACQLTAEEASAVAAGLREAGWFTDVAVADGRMRYQLAEDVRGFAEAAPRPPAPVPSAVQQAPARRPKSPIDDRMPLDERIRLARQKLGRGLAGDVERALGCSLCVDEGVVNHVPEPQHLPRRLELTSYATRTALSRRQAAVLQAALDRVAVTAPSRGPDVRLAAVWWGVQAIWCGELELSAPELERIPVPGIAAALSELTASGWLRADPDEVAATGDDEPALGVIPDLVGDDPSLWLARDAATHLGAWVRRLLKHPLLADASSVHHLVALYLTAHALPDRRVEVPLDVLVAGSAADCAEQVEAAVEELHQAGWLSQPPARADGLLGARLSETAAAIASPSPPVYEPLGYHPADPAKYERGAALVDGRQEDMARWVEDYRTRHGHGPSWRILRNAHIDHDDPMRMEPTHSKAIASLCKSGWLVGVGRPYGLRPGWRYREATHLAATPRPEC